jgi:tetratricopeptide (TPR) repeat protein
MDDFVEIKADKNIRDKIKSELDRYSDNFYWNIKFNIPLLSSSVNSETTNVSNKYGDILKAKIFYIPYENIIVIEPREKYCDNVYYFLNISTGVLSENGQHLKTEIHIRFKLKNKKITEISTIKGKIKFKKAPISLRLNLPYIALYSKSSYKKAKEYDYKLPTIVYPYFIFPLFICLFIYWLMPNYLSYIIGFPICIVLNLIQIVIIIMQYKSKHRISISYYNLGVKYYNKKELLDALDCFKKSFEIDSSNHSAQSAIVKVENYLS